MIIPPFTVRQFNELIKWCDETDSRVEIRCQYDDRPGKGLIRSREGEKILGRHITHFGNNRVIIDPEMRDDD